MNECTDILTELREETLEIWIEIFYNPKRGRVADRTEREDEMKD